LSDEIVARRAAELCLVAERTAPPESAIHYVIGTEVPIPGGAQEHEESLSCTSVEAAQRTIEITRGVFEAHGLHDAWKRVVALVVQPGVEFGDDFVIPYRSEAAKGLSDFIEGVSGMVYEAHSTDYQTVESLRALVSGHFAILKVGPWLTYALREALFSLADLENELARLGKCGTPSGLRQVVAEAMERDPQYWKAYYADDIMFKKFYSYSDRIRYYWNHPEVEASVRRLMANLDMPLSVSLVSQFFPDALSAIRAGRLEPTPRELAMLRIDTVLGFYAEACGQPGPRYGKTAR
jgi:D-tagatose-1,6-bisphosphate aldolase subunit GatZ/KbaZ